MAPLKMATPAAPVQEHTEPCNFRETLNQWEDLNRKRPETAPTASRPNSAKSSPSAPRLFKNKNYLRTNEKFHLEGNSFEGVTFVRTKFGESRKATTRFDATLEPGYEQTLLYAKRPSWCAFGDAYESKVGDLFNFDAIVYELARLAAIADFHENLMDVVQVIPGFGLIEPIFAFGSRRGYVHLTATSFDKLSSCERLVVLISNATGSKIHVRNATKGPHQLADISCTEINGLINDIGRFYRDSGCFGSFMLAYLCGIHSIINIKEGTGSDSHFFKSVLLNVEFPRPFGNFSNVSLHDPSKVKHRPALRDALLTTALVTVSDPGSPGMSEWMPTITVRESLFSVDELVGIISRNASSFFRLWLINCSALIIDTPQSPSDASLANLLAALRKSAPALRHITARVPFAPWYAIEPTHILHPHQIYAYYGGTVPLAPANGVPVTVSALKNCSSLEMVRSAMNSRFVLNMRMHSLRENLLLWIMEADAMTALPQALKSRPGALPLALNPTGYQKITVDILASGIHGMLEEMALGGEGQVQVVASPLYEVALASSSELPKTTIGNNTGINSKIAENSKLPPFGVPRPAPAKHAKHASSSPTQSRSPAKNTTPSSAHSPSSVKNTSSSSAQLPLFGSDASLTRAWLFPSPNFSRASEGTSASSFPKPTGLCFGAEFKKFEDTAIEMSNSCNKRAAGLTPGSASIGTPDNLARAEAAEAAEATGASVEPSPQKSPAPASAASSQLGPAELKSRAIPVSSPGCKGPASPSPRASPPKPNLSAESIAESPESPEPIPLTIKSAPNGK